METLRCHTATQKLSSIADSGVALLLAWGHDESEDMRGNRLSLVGDLKVEMTHTETEA